MLVVQAQRGVPRWRLHLQQLSGGKTTPGWLKECASTSTHVQHISRSSVVRQLRVCHTCRRGRVRW